jgi:hypothetical protein
MTRHPMWCDDFDGDLFRLLPEAEGMLAPVAGMPLWTYANTTHGRLNHPSAWHTRVGLAAFASSTQARDPKPGHFYTQDLIVECTVEEMVRDLFVHQCALVVDSRHVFQFDRWTRDYFTLLYDARGVVALAAPKRVEAARSRMVARFGDVVRRFSLVAAEAA